MPTNALHDAFRKGPGAEEAQLALIGTSAAMLEEEDDSWEGWLPTLTADRSRPLGQKHRGAEGCAFGLLAENHRRATRRG